MTTTTPWLHPSVSVLLTCARFAWIYSSTRLRSAADISFPPSGIDIQTIFIHLGLTLGVVFLFHLHHDAHTPARAYRCAAAYPRSIVAQLALGPAHRRGVRAVECVQGSGGWGGFVLDRTVLDAAQGFAGYMAEAEAGEEYGYGSAEAYAASGSGTTSTSKAHEVIECTGWWNVIPDGSCPGQCTVARETTRTDAGVALPTEDAEAVWKDTGGGRTRAVPHPSRMNKGNDKARAQAEEVMNVRFERRCGVSPEEMPICQFLEDILDPRDSNLTSDIGSAN
ncbi:hypothetical protein DFH08DRAFT_1013939 [Mycena albidolilacea]|uniref:Uncharacterized protein n=1 Tax=Mycena albidolilacea TaxID=1033008 RepID=A0AAD6ZUW2_9AGAR|nr:hypothetical protein DFH08DRAFT_1013939 [Mycena albidolilacea]